MRDRPQFKLFEESIVVYPLLIAFAVALRQFSHAQPWFNLRP